MPKFLGVISNSLPSPCDDRILEFTDLDLLANFLYIETQNLFCEFQRKSEFVKEREILIHENLNKLTEVYEFVKALHTKMVEIESELDLIGFWLCKMEMIINRLEQPHTDYFACKCSPNLEWQKSLQLLVKLCEDMYKIEDQVVKVQECEKVIPVRDPCDVNHRFLQFIDLHTKILERIEQKTYKLTDLLIVVDQKFINAQQRLKGQCYHKPRYEYASDC